MIAPPCSLHRPFQRTSEIRAAGSCHACRDEIVEVKYFLFILIQTVR
jgi:hypothetical protein